MIMHQKYQTVQTEWRRFVLLEVLIQVALGLVSRVSEACPMGGAVTHAGSVEVNINSALASKPSRSKKQTMFIECMESLFSSVR